MAKDKHPCLIFYQSTHVRQRESVEKADDNHYQEQMTLIAKIYRLKIAQKNLNMNLNIHVMVHHIRCQH